jgi:hypothetical protein
MTSEFESVQNLAAPKHNLPTKWTTIQFIAVTPQSYRAKEARNVSALIVIRTLLYPLA